MSYSSSFKFSVKGTFDSLRTFRVPAKDANDQDIQLKYSHQKIIGNGSFGIVYQVKLDNGGQDAAIKKVLQDKNFKNRELELLKVLNHPNICSIMAYFYSQNKKEKKNDEIYLNIVMEFVPETVDKIARHYLKSSQPVPALLIKLYMYQLFRCLAYSHALGVCHRDIKPQNLLVHPITGVLKLCDFGSAKVLMEGGSNISYICSRYYRAPELIFGADRYDCSIDMWSSACVMGELLLGEPLFPGKNGMDQIVTIIKILGTPTNEEVLKMNPNYNILESNFPSNIKPQTLEQVFGDNVEPTAIDLLSKILVYDPKSRITASEALIHSFFDELKNPETRLLTGKDLPDLFNFTREELSIRPDLIHQLVPNHCIQKIQENIGIHDLNEFIPIPLNELRLTTID